MNITPDISNRITALRFPLIVAVVYIHASFAEMVSGKVGHTALFVQELISDTVACVAVPLFFVISGYLLFQGYELRVSSYKKKLVSRIRTLLIPFLFWNVATLLFFALLQNIPALSSFFSGANKPICDYGTFDFFASIFGLRSYPFAYQFWFIRDLMVLLIISPLILLLARRIPIISFLFLFALWFGESRNPGPPSYGVLFFFFTGALLAVHDLTLAITDRRSGCFALLFVLAAFVDASTIECKFNVYLHKITILSGLCTAWTLAGYSCRCERAKYICTTMSAHAFIVYATHEPVVTVIKKVGFRIVSLDNDATITLLYLVSPVITVVLTLCAGIIFQKICPRTYGIATGGR